MLKKRNQKEAEEQHSLLNNFLKHSKWISLIAYPFFLLSILSLNGQSDPTNRLLNLELQPGQKPLQATHSSQLEHIYIQNLHDVFYLIFHESDSSFEALEGLEKLRIEAIEALKEPSPRKGFLISEIKLQWAFLKIKYGEDWGAFWSLRSAYKTIEDNKEAFPNFQLNQRTSGLLKVLFGVTPENYQWIFNLFGMKGSVQDGILELQKSIGNEGIYSLETNIVLGMIYSHLFENFQMSTSFIPTHPWSESGLARYFQGIILSKSHRANEARHLWMSEELQIPHVNYLVAETYFQEGNYTDAIDHYQQFIEAFEGNSYKKDAFLKIALSYKSIGNEQQFENFLKQAKQSESNQTEIDKNAEKLINSINILNLQMLQLRFAIDGGFFTKADSLLIDLNNVKLTDLESIELVYRQGRMAHIQAKSDLAVQKYREVISKAELIEESYFAPNSYLQLGYLQQQLNETEMAKMYFNKVLTFKNHPYKASLDSKAKVALSQLDASNE